MKRTLLTVVVVVGAFVLGMMVRSPKATMLNSSAAIAAPAAAPAMVPIPPRCPRIHDALENLRHAEEEMHNAGHDFCGHKVEAMRTVHAAIEQLRMAEDCDRCR